MSREALRGLERALSLTREALGCVERLRSQVASDPFDAALKRLQEATPPRREAA